jgi:hypothetical protein
LGEAGIASWIFGTAENNFYVFLLDGIDWIFELPNEKNYKVY